MRHEGKTLHPTFRVNPNVRARVRGGASGGAMSGAPVWPSHDARGESEHGGAGEREWANAHGSAGGMRIVWVALIIPEPGYAFH